MIAKFETLNSAKSAEAMASWIDSKGKKIPQLSGDYSYVREQIVSIYASITPSDGTKLKPYQKDVQFGVRLKTYLEGQNWFSLRLAADTDFWRYLSVMVVPDIVADRNGYNNEDYYWKKPSRIWLRSVWAYSFLSWQGSEEETIDLLSRCMFNTDTKLNLVERSGRMGTNIELYNLIMRAYGSLPTATIKDYDSKTKTASDTLFRSVMRLNTAELLVKEPELCICGIEGYVTELFAEFNISVDLAKDEPDNRSNKVSASPSVTENVTPVVEDKLSSGSKNRIKVIKGDITSLNVDAIVNAAKSSLKGGSGVDGAIHRAAGPELDDACAKIGYCALGDSCITEGFNLPCKYIIHTVGPNCNITAQNDKRAFYLRSCYDSCMDLAEKYKLKSIAFCCISTGNYGYPREEAAIVALNAINDRLRSGLDIEVTICCYTQEDKDIYERLINKQ